MSQRTASPHTSPKRRAAKPSGGQSAHSAAPCPASTAKGTAGRASRFASGVSTLAPSPAAHSAGSVARHAQAETNKASRAGRSKKEKRPLSRLFHAFVCSPAHITARAAQNESCAPTSSAASGPVNMHSRTPAAPMAVRASLLRQASMPPYRNSKATPARTALGPAPASIKNQSTIAQDTAAAPRRRSLVRRRPYNMPEAAERCRPETTSTCDSPAARNISFIPEESALLSPNAAARATLPASWPSMRVRPLHSASRICCAAPDMPPRRPTTSARCTAASIYTPSALRARA